MSECLLSFWALRFLYHAHIRIHIVSNNPYKKKTISGYTSVNSELQKSMDIFVWKWRS